MTQTDDMLPPVREQRAILQNMMTTYQRNGYQELVQAEALEVQKASSPTEENTRLERIKQFREQSNNSFASARAIKMKLGGLPIEEKE